MQARTATFKGWQNVFGVFDVSISYPCFSVHAIPLSAHLRNGQFKNVVPASRIVKQFIPLAALQKQGLPLDTDDRRRRTASSIARSSVDVLHQVSLSRAAGTEQFPV